MSREYGVQSWNFNKYSPKEKIGKVSHYQVTDKNENESEDERPPVAIFTVNALYDADTQKIRAEKLADYLNDINSKISMYEILSNSSMTAQP